MESSLFSKAGHGFGETANTIFAGVLTGATLDPHFAKALGLWMQGLPTMALAAQVTSAPKFIQMLCDTQPSCAEKAFLVSETMLNLAAIGSIFGAITLFLESNENAAWIFFATEIKTILMASIKMCIKPKEACQTFFTQGLPALAAAMQILFVFCLELKGTVPIVGLCGFLLSQIIRYAALAPTTTTRQQVVEIDNDKERPYIPPTPDQPAVSSDMTDDGKNIFRFIDDNELISL